MCSRHAEPGAGAPDIFDALADYLVADAFLEALKDDACPLCHGSGVMMGGDEYQPCPKCKGAA
jgi:hypothetical protein